MICKHNCLQTLYDYRAYFLIPDLQYNPVFKWSWTVACENWYDVSDMKYRNFIIKYNIWW